MRCKHCGEEISPDEIICPHCGEVSITTKKERAYEIDSIFQDVPVQKQKEQQNKSKGIKRSSKPLFIKSLFSLKKGTIKKTEPGKRQQDDEMRDITRLLVIIEAVIICILVVALIVMMTLIFNYRSSGNDTTTSSYGADIYYVTNAGDGASLLKKAESDSDSKTQLFPGNAVELMEKTTEDYWKVMDYESGETGYISTKQLTDTADKVKEGSLTTDRSVKFVVFVTNTVDGLEIREKLGFDGTMTVATAGNGYALGVVEQTNNTFWRVYDYHSQTTGYAERAYLTKSYGDVCSGATESIGTATIKAEDKFVSLYTHPTNDEDFITGRIRNNSEVNIIEKTNKKFWLIYDDTSNQFAYVDRKFVEGADDTEIDESAGSDKDVPEATDANTYYVAGTDELSLRSTPEKSEENEIVTLYYDETVVLIDKTNDDFWEVYSPKHDMRGYVNRYCLAQY
ncbi:MAG: zinc ribbon domain-containing protein [Bacillota bacterium]|nr:zinc ribbon domain-containing protein [Bacillota bacterium]